MTLGEISAVAGVPAKWILNGSAVWRGHDYTLSLAVRLAVVHQLQSALGMSLARAFLLAERAMDAPNTAGPVLIPDRDGADVQIIIDLSRIQSAVAARYAAWHAGYGARDAGRPRRARRLARAVALKRATDWGLDLSLLHSNLARSPEQRLRQLDAMVAFRRGVRRVATSAGDR
jgi:hypothetical protein